MEINRTRNAIKGTVSGVFLKSVSVIGSFLIQTIIVKVLGKEYAGISSLFTSILSVLSLAELGFGSALVYSMYRPIAEGDIAHLNNLLAYYRRVYNILCGFLLTVGVAILPFIKYFVKEDCPPDLNLYILYLIYLVNSVSAYIPPAYRRSIIYAYQRRDIDNTYTCLVKAAQYLLQILLLLTTKNYYLFALVLAFSNIPVTLLISARTKKDFPDIKPEGMISKSEREVVKNKVAALFGHQLGGKVIISSDSIIISSFLGAGILGIYSNYYYIFYSVIEMLEIIKSSIVAGVGNKIVTSERKELFNLFKRSIYIWMMIVGWASTCLLCMYQPFIELWLGKKYLYPLSILIVIIIYFYTWQFRSVLVVFKDAAGLWTSDWYKPYLGSVINIVGSISLIIYLNSVVGVLIPTIIIMCCIYFPIETHVIYNNLFIGESKVSFYLNVLKYCIINCSGMALSFLLCSVINTSSLLINVIIYFIISSVCAIILFILLTYRTDECRWLIANIKKRLVRSINFVRR
ncbi:hypothetical protein D6853_13145 [Butyrivibrio sp. X503]|uniref:lipopolysaccharide biosynthesis protein n=1 Tax=Butyrivibrio sp. X503 TaxID=2364878 RepID=UPI000EA85166|nr:hypothetical protein [Butyrivibrio sp. X503]RKM54467.1 hypothetical protein D6853_13145 [Butyrivibrio sp. X503]